MSDQTDNRFYREPMTDHATADGLREAVENRIYFDTEFIEDGSTIDLLSIGLVREDGATYYAEPGETDRSRASEWVQENVLPYLTGPVKPRRQIAKEIVAFAGADPEFWAWYADYDWVALCQLFGTMMDLPNGWPMYARDFKQVVDERGLGAMPKQTDGDGPEHNALSDARWLARVAAPHLAAHPVPSDTEEEREACTCDGASCRNGYYDAESVVRDRAASLARQTPGREGR